MDRIGEICSALAAGRTMADVGCDHGYLSALALKRGLFEKIYLSDISAESLKKAETLLKEEIKAGKCVPVLADGMKGLPPDIDCLLIAGMGGEEIVRILKEGYLPAHFVFQPMKNADKLRQYLVDFGACLERDYTFFSEGYFYDLIAGKNSGGSNYTPLEIEFGRQNLREKREDFKEKLRLECKKIEAYLLNARMSETNRLKLREKSAHYRNILDETF